MGHTISTVTSVLALAVLGTAACASNPNKELKEARAEDAETVREQKVEQIEKSQKEQVEQIEKRTAQTVEGADRVPASSQERAKAQAEMVESRKKFQANASARLQKLEARLNEAEKKLRIAGGRVPTKTWDKAKMASELRNGLSNQVNHLAETSDAQWGDEKERIDARLDQLESTVGDVQSQADALAP
jgi:uncharacterized phage infection (PIP) family protein YhgE